MIDTFILEFTYLLFFGLIGLAIINIALIITLVIILCK